MSNITKVVVPASGEFEALYQAEGWGRLIISRRDRAVEIPTYRLLHPEQEFPHHPENLRPPVVAQLTMFRDAMDFLYPRAPFSQLTRDMQALAYVIASVSYPVVGYGPVSRDVIGVCLAGWRGY